MNFYNIQLSHDPKIIGVKNGIYQVELIEKMYNSVTFSQFKNMFFNQNLEIDKIPSFEFEFYFRLLKGAKETDFISFCPHLNHCHFLINENIQDIFSNFKIQPFTLLNANIFNETKQTTLKKFRMFYSGFQSWEIVNFEETVFNYGGFGNIPISEHTFSNIDELKSFKGIPKLKVLSLTNKFDNSLDLFYSRLGGLFVSERLKISIENALVNGIVFNNEIKVITNC